MHRASQRSFRRAVWAAAVSGALVNCIILILCFSAALFIMWRTGFLLVVSTEYEDVPEPEASVIFFATEMDGVLVRNQETGERFARTASKDPDGIRRINLDPDEEVLFEIVREVFPPGIPSNFVNSIIVTRNGGEYVLFVINNCLECKFVPGDWEDALNQEGFEFKK